jgi:hypothetical protein
LKVIAWTQWALFYSPYASRAERYALMQKIVAGLTDAEREQVDHLWPFDEYEIVPKPRTKVTRGKPARAPTVKKRKALPAPVILEG